MSRAMVWLPIAIRVAIAPVLVGALALLAETPRSISNQAAAFCLMLLAAIHVLYWWRPWPSQSQQHRAFAAIAGMIVINFVLLNLVPLDPPAADEPLLWLYPALIAGAGLRAPTAVIAVGLTALAAASPLALQERLVHPVGPLSPAGALGASHSVLVSILLAGVAMAAVRQLIALNRDLQATRAELADVAVAAERERLARELHDLLGRTLSLIAVKAELTGRLSAKGDPSAKTELADIQRLARQAVRDVREAVTGTYAPSVEAELAAAGSALQTAGIEVSVDKPPASLDPAHESTIAWAIREAVTNVVKHSDARSCRIHLNGDGNSTTLEVEDDGRGPRPNEIRSGTGLDGLAQRVHALGGTLDIDAHEGRGFRLRVRLGAAVPQPISAEVAL